MDYECPKSAPNYFDRHLAYKKFLKWNNKQEERYKIELKPDDTKKEEPETDIDFNQIFGAGRRKRQSETESEPNVFNNLNSTSTIATMSNTTVLPLTKLTEVKGSDSNDYYEDSGVDNVTVITQKPRIFFLYSFVIFNVKFIGFIASKQFNETCKRYARSFLEWMDAVGPKGWSFLNETLEGDDKVIYYFYITFEV